MEQTSGKPSGAPVRHAYLKTFSIAVAVCVRTCGSSSVRESQVLASKQTRTKAPTLLQHQLGPAQREAALPAALRTRRPQDLGRTVPAKAQHPPTPPPQQVATDNRSKCAKSTKPPCCCSIHWRQEQRRGPPCPLWPPSPATPNLTIACTPPALAFNQILCSLVPSEIGSISGCPSASARSLPSDERPKSIDVSDAAVKLCADCSPLTPSLTNESGTAREQALTHGSTSRAEPLLYRLCRVAGPAPPASYRPGPARARRPLSSTLTARRCRCGLVARAARAHL